MKWITDIKDWIVKTAAKPWRCILGRHQWGHAVHYKSAYFRKCDCCNTTQVFRRPSPWNKGGWQKGVITYNAKGHGFIEGTNGNQVRIV